MRCCWNPTAFDSFSQSKGSGTSWTLKRRRCPSSASRGGSVLRQRRAAAVRCGGPGVTFRAAAARRVTRERRHVAGAAGLPHRSSWDTSSPTIILPRRARPGNRCVRLVDPMGGGWQPFGLDSADVVYFCLVNPALLAWTIKVVVSVVVGHVIAG